MNTTKREKGKKGIVTKYTGKKVKKGLFSKGLNHVNNFYKSRMRYTTTFVFFPQPAEGCDMWMYVQESVYSTGCVVGCGIVVCTCHAHPQAFHHQASTLCMHQTPTTTTGRGFMGRGETTLKLTCYWSLINNFSLSPPCSSFILLPFPLPPF